MPKTHPLYPAEFRQQLIESVRAGRTPAELIPGHGPNHPELGGLSTAERKELARLRRQGKQLQTERDILAKATAWFAGRSGVTPISFSNS